MKAARTSETQDTEFVRCPAVQDKREEAFEGCVQDNAGVPTEETGKATVGSLSFKQEADSHFNKLTACTF